jgi:putrescine transport system permease protein
MGRPGVPELGYPLLHGADRVTALINPGIRDRLWRRTVIYLPYAWLVLFFLVPFLLVLKISFADPVIAQPPYSDLLSWSEDSGYQLQGSLDNFRFLFEDNLYVISYLKSIRIALVATVLCLLLGFPMAYAIARTPQPWRNLLLLLVMLPFWTSSLLQLYAWMVMLSQQGVINHLLLGLGVIEAPLHILYTDTAVYIGIVYTFLPFMVLPLYATLERLDPDLHEAAADLGASPWAVFRDVTLPLALPGIVAGALLVFIPALGSYIIPAMLGGLDTLMIGRTLYDEFFINRDWPLASAVAIVLLLVLIIPIMLFQRLQQEKPA